MHNYTYYDKNIPNLLLMLPLVYIIIYKYAINDFEMRFCHVKQITHEQIEELRLLMQEVASDKDLTDQRVVSISTKLDLLINEYYAAKKRFNHPVM